MADVVKKHSISSELAQKMVDAAVAKARELGVSENVAILDDGPAPSACSISTPEASSLYATTTIPASAQRCRYQS
jgi:uncharacterized protein GlcG (DUF336 family)